MKNFVQNGDFIDFTAGATIESGDLVQVGSLFGVSMTDVANGAKGTLALKGVFELPKLVAAGDAVAAAGDPVYFKTGKVTGDDDTASNPLCGYALEAAAAAKTTVKVKLLG
jgi:predicted RecA/RadA family phage recombinase